MSPCRLELEQMFSSLRCLLVSKYLNAIKLKQLFHILIVVTGFLEITHVSTILRM